MIVTSALIAKLALSLVLFLFVSCFVKFGFIFHEPQFYTPTDELQRAKLEKYEKISQWVSILIGLAVAVGVYVLH